ncbi:hypothetical protein CE91St30_20430 [Raoultibacter timonensis]|uniref:Uncharacterized protein n=1 Tax=Raoultibacter timonensis TaxID=1907662 RepID=A0ABM7WK72_9ACTN|nr:hypothetical protein CE91St30_20430 [Raoultibacter timonensis]BDF51313.1 hypothetical protein CE91St31_20430 [Raoultibacter timonensis]
MQPPTGIWRFEAPNGRMSILVWQQINARMPRPASTPGAAASSHAIGTGAANRTRVPEKAISNPTCG